MLFKTNNKHDQVRFRKGQSFNWLENKEIFYYYVCENVIIYSEENVRWVTFNNQIYVNVFVVYFVHLCIWFVYIYFILLLHLQVFLYRIYWLFSLWVCKCIGINTCCCWSGLNFCAFNLLLETNQQTYTTKIFMVSTNTFIDIFYYNFNIYLVLALISFSHIKVFYFAKFS